MDADGGLLSWLVAYAVVLTAVSVTATVAGEQLLAWRSRTLDVAGSLTSVVAGVAYLAVKTVFAKGAVLALALFVYEHRLFELDWRSPVSWLVVFVARDLVYYWIHRAEHRVAALWASHLVHHSLERFTFTSAVRLPWMESLYKPLLGLWVPLLGFHPAAFAAMGALVLLVGQLQHTELGRARSVADWVFVTPAVHRVHHGSNPGYVDKNFGSMLVVWDRLFGTYAPETVPVTYGLVGAKRIATPAGALVGGYPALAARVRATPGLAAQARVLLGAP